MKNTGLLAIGVGALAIWYLTKASGPKWPVGTNLGYGITVIEVSKVGNVWMYIIHWEDQGGGQAGPWTQAQVEAYLALYS